MTSKISTRNRIGAYALHAQHDPRVTTAPARAAFLASFEAKVDPDRVLPEAERQRRAASARKEHFARLAYLSAKVRAQKNTRHGRRRVSLEVGDAAPSSD